MTNEQILHSLLMIAVIAAVTFLLRGLPFLIFGSKRKTPDFVAWLGNVLPHAVMGMLLVYCFKDISFVSAPFRFPEIVSCIAVVLLHAWRRNSLLSIGGGTVLYMVLIAVL
jgi:branched-subunit amino acid transport protein AzlD